MEENKKITQSAVMELGFTKKMIEALLPPPALVKNPMYRSAAPMKLWDEAIVLAVMQTEAYAAAKAVADKRRLASLKAVATKTAKTNRVVGQMIDFISIPLFDDATIVIKAVDSRNSFLRSKDIFYCPVKPSELDEATKQRWVVNYIRHNLTKYDKNLVRLAGTVGGGDAMITLKVAILARIAVLYPTFAKECRRQAECC